ncbi:MAG: phenylpyruvate tautomerase MIF-related protein [Ruminococcus flavefaciens]|nr:phenylpyruvate tautomerase MIF-related protein [Ruminococcus flavefaciens]MCM1232615.1 phenylpyruvate tautomerase MIF-related protein [Ruminococcus flavefaciens]
MPICQMQTNFKWESEQRTAFLAETAQTLSEILEKPLPAVMVMLTDSHMYMNRSEDTVFFAEFRYVKNFVSADEKAEFLEYFADRMLSLIQKYTQVDPYRIYMQFTEMPRDGAWRYIEKGEKK